MTTPRMDATAHAAIERYLTAVASQLSGPARTREAILAELRDGLLEAAAEGLERGAAPARAAAAAIGEFGDAATVGAGFAAELAGATARRAALTLIRTGPLVGALWVAASTAGQLGAARAGAPWRWPAAPTGASLAFPLLCGAVAIAGLATLLVVASTGRLSRWLPAGPGLAAIGAAAVAGAAMLVDCTLLGLLAIQAITRPGSLTWAPVAVAAAVSLTRLVLAGRATRRCWVARAALT